MQVSAIRTILTMSDCNFCRFAGGDHCRRRHEQELQTHVQKAAVIRSYHHRVCHLLFDAESPHSDTASSHRFMTCEHQAMIVSIDLIFIHMCISTYVVSNCTIRPFSHPLRCGQRRDGCRPARPRAYASCASPWLRGATLPRLLAGGLRLYRKGGTDKFPLPPPLAERELRGSTVDKKAQQKSGDRSRTQT